MADHLPKRRNTYLDALYMSVKILVTDRSLEKGEDVSVNIFKNMIEDMLKNETIKKFKRVFISFTLIKIGG